LCRTTKKFETQRTAHPVFPKSAKHIFHRYYGNVVPDIHFNSPQFKGHLQTIGYTDVMATEDNTTHYDYIKMFEDQNTKNNGQRERKRPKKNKALWNLNQNPFITLAF